MKKYIPVLIFVCLWVAWFVCYPYFLVWLEGYSFFSTLPDFTIVHFKLPLDIFRYIGAFLLQFYAWPAVGAMVQALIPILFLFCMILIVRRLFKDHDDVMWLSYIPLPFFIYYQMSDMTLARTIMILSAGAVATGIVFLATIPGKPFGKLPALLKNKILGMSVIVLSLSASVGIVVNDGPLTQYHEDVAHIEYLGEHGQWNRILENVSVQDAMTNEYKRKYALLALAETGQLTEHAFRYGLSSAEDFLFHDVQEPYCLGFNELFYRSLGMNNPAIYSVYQQAVQSLPGLSFDTVRCLADIYLEQKDYVMAKKYIDIMDHTTCHRKWVRERRARLEKIKGAVPEYRMGGQQFILQSFLPDMSAMVDLYPQEKKYADYLLCGILAEKDGNTFYNVFNIIASRMYPDGQNIPELYQQALLLIASHELEVLQKYNIDESVWKQFNDFTEYMRQGKTAQAKRKYAGTYWAYVY